MPLSVPRDRQGSFEPRLVPKGSRRTGGPDEMIISLYAGGMTVRDIGHHLQRTLGTELSHETIFKITNSVLEEVKAWQATTTGTRQIYPIVYLDALPVLVRRRPPGPQPGGARRGPGRSRPGQARVRDLGPGRRGREVLGRGVRRAAQPRGARRADRVLRRTAGFPGGGGGDLAADHGADPRGAPDPGRDAVRVLRRPQAGGRCARSTPPRPSRPRRSSSRRSPIPRSGGATPRRWRPGRPRGSGSSEFLEFPPELRKIIYTCREPLLGA